VIISLTRPVERTELSANISTIEKELASEFSSGANHRFKFHSPLFAWRGRTGLRQS
jgi:hypothetical protein